MDNLGWRLLPLWDQGVILGALRDMERAGRGAAKQEDEKSAVKPQEGRAMSDGKAVTGLGEQLTPKDTPLFLPGGGNELFPLF